MVCSRGKLLLQGSLHPLNFVNSCGQTTTTSWFNKLKLSVQCMFASFATCHQQPKGLDNHNHYITLSLTPIRFEGLGKTLY